MTPAPQRLEPPIAIVGIGAVYPGATTLAEYWRNVVHGRDLVTDVPSHYWRVEDYHDPDPGAWGKTYARRGAFVPRVRFDPLEFGIPPRTLPSIDTVQLLSLLTARTLLESCVSFRNGAVDRENVSVILGTAAATEMMTQVMGHTDHPHWVFALRESGIPEPKIREILERASRTFVEWSENTFPGALANVTAGRIANRLNLGGTNCIVDAACASSLAAVSMAVQELQLGRADLVVSGGADAQSDIYAYMCFTRTPAISPTGDCRPFSSQADGTILGEGIGLVALRRVADAERDGDTIYGLIRGIGSSSDGRARSIYAPLSAGQALAYRRAYAQAGISPAQIELVEAHGTATRANDAAEFESLTTVYREADPDRRRWCALGSVKSQIGHAKTAAGAASLIKAVLALHHGVLPPTIKVSEPNPELAVDESPFYLNTVARPWTHEPGSTRKAATSSLGFGGTNFHVVLEEYGGPGARPKRISLGAPRLLPLGAADEGGLTSSLDRLAERLRSASLDELSREAQQAFDPASALRLALVATSADDARSLAADARSRVASGGSGFSVPGRIRFRRERLPSRVAFLFPGQGSQYLDMGRELALEYELFRRVFDEAAARDSTGAPALHEVVYPPPAFDEAALARDRQRLVDTRWAQPAIGAVCLGYLALMRRLGVEPCCVGGHSYGELPALLAAGVLAGPADLIALSRERGRLMAETAGQASGMTAVSAPRALVAEHLHRWESPVSIANVNAPDQVVIAGSIPDLERVEERLTVASIRFLRLPVSAAFHSSHVGAARSPFAGALAGMQISSPAVPVYSNATGEPYPREPDRIRDVLAGQLSQCVLFEKQIQAMHAAGARIFVEVGPGRVLTGLVSRCLQGAEHLAVALDGRPGEGILGLHDALAELACAGVGLRYDALFDDFEVETPDRREYSEAAVWIDGSNVGKPFPAPVEGSIGQTDVSDIIRSSLAGIQARPAATARAASSPAPVDARDWLAAIEEIQSNLMVAQKDYQEALTRSHLAFVKSSEEVLTAVARATGGAEDEPPSAGTAVAPRDVPRESASGPVTAARAFVDETAYEHAMLTVVAEITGYPIQALSLDADLEADLGIDSIKKVELLSGFKSRVPGLEIEDPQSLYTLKTLREIVERVRTRQAAAAPRPPSGSGRPVERLVVESVPEGEPCEMLPGLDGSRKVHLVEDNRGVAPALSGLLRSLGLEAEVVREAPEDAVAVVFLKGIDEPTATLPIDALVDLNRCAFETARRCASSLKDRQGVFVMVQDTAGDFNASGEAGPRAWSGGMAALARTVALECPGAAVKAIDVQCGHHGPEDLAQVIFRELTQGGRSREVGLRPGGPRVRPRARPRDLTATGTPLRDGTVVLASGGARGITAACVKALARRSRLRIALLGTTPPSGPEPDPRRIEVESTLEELRTSGAEVAYLPCDVRDAAAVEDAVRKVHDSFGPVQVVVHGAGVNVDRSIREKTLVEFDTVLSTKVAGLRNLLHATRDDALTHLCCFSSIVARDGNAGQADYAMANEILNRVCRSEARSRGGSCQVKSLGWGPWDAGMVSPHHRRLFELAGLAALPLDVGSHLFVRELEDPDPDGAVEIILCSTTGDERVELSR